MTAIETGCAVIIGGSAGIGLALAREFARRGTSLLLVARAADRLETAADSLRRAHRVRVETLPLDATAPEAPERLLAALASHDLTPAYVVLSAGRWSYGETRRLKTAELRAVLEANVVAPHALFRALVPLIPAGGGVLFLGSLAAITPIPYASAYSGAKACMHDIAMALRSEARDCRLRISVLAPGLVATDFVTDKGSGLSRRFLELISTRPETAARAGYRGLMAGSFLIVPGLLWRLLWIGSLIVPKRLLSVVLTRFFRPPR